ncbi:glycosyltransferase [Sphingobacterium humi]|uniref:Glycosyltransferase n=1 Tax=Sphingobacterium humi TaxID=1796905 RepID=A0A6N8L3J2_9SPHI|nr:glycosyltransferase [Sphingobacterium humi]MVZ63644.1 glycosyltransferase [Sphingobacterium humi]
MRICQVINSLSSGGAEVFTSQLAVAQKKLGHDVFLITYQGAIDEKGRILNKYLTDNGVIVKHHRGFKKGSYGYIIAFLFLLRQIAMIRPNVVHAHLQLSDLFIFVVRKLLFFYDFKIVRTLHNKRRAARLSNSVETSMVTGYDSNVACSDFVRDNYENTPLRKHLISIPNGIDLSESDKLKDLTQEKARRLLNLPQDAIIFANVGSMYLSDNAISKKNQKFIVEAVDEVSKHQDKFICLLIGDGTQRSQLENDVNTRGLSEQILFTGNVLNVYTYIKAVDFFVMPSIDEGLPIALIEAVCSGKYAITSGIDAFIPFKSKSVKLLNSFELDEFVNEIRFAISNIYLCRALGIENISYFRNKFDINITARKYLRLYNDL